MLKFIIKIINRTYFNFLDTFFCKNFFNKNIQKFYNIILVTIYYEIILIEIMLKKNSNYFL